jgi:hypothetical protein
MVDRCYCQSSTAYPAYGGKGVKVCGEWRTFLGFLADMGKRPSRSHSLDRIDNGKGYEPGNCRWATRTEQNRNRGNTVRLCVAGETQPLAVWAERMGIPARRIHTRLSRGWTAERAVMA